MVGEEEPLASETSPMENDSPKLFLPPSIISTFNLTSSEDLAGTYCRLFKIDALSRSKSMELSLKQIIRN